MLTGYVFSQYSPWVMSTGSPPPSDRPIADAPQPAGGAAEPSDDHDHARELRSGLERAERLALTQPSDWAASDIDPSWAAWAERALNQGMAEGLHKEWCGIHGITKPDEIRLARYMLNEIDQDFRTEVVLDVICQRWPAVFTKWIRKRWAEVGVSLRTSWLTDRGREELRQQIEITWKRGVAMGLEYETELHSTHPDAVQATRNTIEMLGGKLIEREGRWFLQGDSRPAHFIQWAAVKQGYVRGAKPVDSGGFTEEQRKAEDRLMATLRDIDAKDGRA